MATLARKVCLLENCGREQKYVHAELGFNSRMDSLQAVVLRAKLPRLADWNEQRCRAANRYHELLGELEDAVMPRTPPATSQDGICTSYRYLAGRRPGGTA